MVTKISVCGYSLGGLIARYLVGILHQRKFFETVTPANFYTFATPHVGLPRYPTLFSNVAYSLGPKLLGRTGCQLFLQDEWIGNGKPLLTVMADHERVFYKGLCQFPNITFYANAVHDQTVPYVTAAIELEDPYLEYPANGAEVTLHDKYPFLLVDYVIPEEAPPLPPKPTLFSPAWFKKFKTPLPPAFYVGFPLNILLILLSPVIVPVFLGSRMVQLLSSSYSSKKRIKNLQSHESHKNRLIYILAELEKNVENRIVDFVETSEANASTSTSADINGTGQLKLSSNSETVSETSGANPTLTKLQKELIKLLSTLPNLKKEIAFIHTLTNTHSAIVCRDVEKYKFYSVGKGILSHWAYNFEF